jgi:hypothetical protein
MITSPSTGFRDHVPGRQDKRNQSWTSGAPHLIVTLSLPAIKGARVAQLLGFSSPSVKACSRGVSQPRWAVAFSSGASLLGASHLLALSLPLNELPVAGSRRPPPSEHALANRCVVRDIPGGVSACRTCRCGARSWSSRQGYHCWNPGLCLLAARCAALVLCLAKFGRYIYPRRLLKKPPASVHIPLFSWFGGRALLGSPGCNRDLCSISASQESQTATCCRGRRGGFLPLASRRPRSRA